MNSTSEREHFGENRDAFEQEERQVDRAGDLVGGARLPGDALRGGGGELADAEAGADDDHAEPERDAEQLQISAMPQSPP